LNDKVSFSAENLSAVIPRISLAAIMVSAHVVASPGSVRQAHKPRNATRSISVTPHSVYVWIWLPGTVRDNIEKPSSLTRTTILVRALRWWKGSAIFITVKRSTVSPQTRMQTKRRRRQRTSSG